MSGEQTSNALFSRPQFGLAALPSQLPKVQQATVASLALAHPRKALRVVNPASNVLEIDGMWVTVMGASTVDKINLNTL